MKNKTVIFVCFALLLAFLPTALAEVIAGGTGGNVTFINPDNSTTFFDASNATTFSHISNWPDGWWDFPDPLIADDELWVFGAFLGVIAIAIAVAFTVMKRSNNQ